jgi:ABC-2 type transport system ATP-binding protein
MTTYTSAVEISHLRKTYGNLVAVEDVSVSVAEGEIFGILGPNGAGKTTAIECAIGLRRPDAGTIRLLGLDPHADRDTIHEIVGVQLQTTAFPAKLRTGEILEEYRSFYRRPADVSELVEALGLAGKLRDYYRSLSGWHEPAHAHRAAGAARTSATSPRSARPCRRSRTRCSASSPRRCRCW